MSIQNSYSSDKNRLNIQINGRFDFSLHREFREAYRNESGVKEYVVNLSKADYMDSSALGMLLLLREHAVAHNATVVLGAPMAAVRKILTIANFDKLFRID
jgi:HptB-dependent secretion and biofilm anti anti-sigma factor